jgi:hypothetical protein
MVEKLVDRRWSSSWPALIARGSDALIAEIAGIGTWSALIAAIGTWAAVIAAIGTWAELIAAIRTWAELIAETALIAGL